HRDRRLVLGAAELRPRVLAQGDAFELGKKVEVPPVAAELAVGDTLQADRLLLGDNGADRALLKRHVLFLARFGEPGRAQEAAYVVGTERWLHARRPERLSMV